MSGWLPVSQNKWLLDAHGGEVLFFIVITFKPRAE